MSVSEESSTSLHTGSEDLRQLLVRGGDLEKAGLEDFSEMSAPSSDEDPPPMTGPTPESTALLNRAFTDKPAREVRTSFVNADSSIVVDEGVSEREAGTAAAWMADMRQVYAECAAWTISLGDQEIPVQVTEPADDPSKPLDLEQQFGDEALMRTMIAGTVGEQARITTLLVRDGGRVLELTFRSLAAEPGSPEAAPLAVAMARFLELAPARFLAGPAA
ncbi:hypothetical protein ABTY59_24915 [Streptomyces sp. NPDC096079]|uniref:hypothetical protein n=1 Tax=unclassified Streptomyces TaxID=2593676 RepID=UPI003325E393